MCIYLRPCNIICSIGLTYVDIVYAFRCLVFVVQLFMGAGCSRVIQMFEWCKSFVGKVWGAF